VATHYASRNRRRRELVRQAFRDGSHSLNGIDYLEVADDQRSLTIHCLHDVIPLTQDNIRITGGIQVRDLQVEAFAVIANQVRIRCTQAGDYSPYTLSLIRSDTRSDPPPGIDPMLASIEFHFWATEFSELDCRKPATTTPLQETPPAIDYLSKDYASFRQLMFDRLSVTLPQWQERNPADIGVMVVELLAYAADQLSYHQDAVATEAYLGTCRRRVSMARHARLLDYFMHNGCNARSWVVMQLGALPTPSNREAAARPLPSLTLLGPKPCMARPGAQILTRTTATTMENGHISKEQAELALSQGAQVFETLHDITLFPALNELRFYSWGDDRSVLAQGCTQATLVDPTAEVGRTLEVHRVLILAQIRDAGAGRPEGGTPPRRHAVRLTDVEPSVDPLTGTTIVKVRWHRQDALPFDLPVSALDGHGVPIEEPLSVAYGNVVLVDAGRTRIEDDLRTLPGWQRLRPRLEHHPLTYQGHRQTLDRQWQLFDPQAPAVEAMHWDLRDVWPAIGLQEPDRQDGTGASRWQPQRDLLVSDRFARDFVVEAEDDGRTTLRFGDDVQGKQPRREQPLQAIYRTGNGQAGNVGAYTLSTIRLEADNLDPAEQQHLPCLQETITLFNPLPATGGVDPEPLEQVRRDAPQAFRQDLRRAVTEADYVTLVERYPGVQKALATSRWSGSWQTIFITVDRNDGIAVDDAFKQELHAYLEQFRLSGHDLEIEGPRFMPLDITLRIHTSADYFRSEVKQALLEEFSNRLLGSGRAGFFHPNQFTFGQPVYLSQIITRAMAVEGVEAADAERFQTLNVPQRQSLRSGVIRVDRLDIARLDNLPNLPEHGRMTFIMEGGR
jgi:hypothetical protein